MKNNGIIYIFLAAVFFALGGLLIKLNTWSSLSIHGMRCFFALFVMFAYMKSKGHKFRINKVVILGALANFSMGLAYVMANKMTSAANAIVLEYTQPVFIILMLWAFWKKKPDKLAVGACLLAFAGVVCCFMDQITPSGMIGNFLAIFAGFTYGVVFLIKKMPDSDFDSSVVISFLLSFAICIPGLLGEADHTVTNWVLVAILGVCQQGFAFICLSKGLETVPPVTASITSMIEPILNPILVAVFYHEMIGPLAIIGAAIVLTASTGYNILTIKQETKAETGT